MSLAEALLGNDHQKAYALSKEIAARSAESEEYYASFDEFAELLSAKNSYVRARGFCLCCAQARWDRNGKLEKALPQMLGLLHDEKPTAVRRCLSACREIFLYRPELAGRIKAELENMDLTKYKDSMAPLIRNDVKELLSLSD